MSLEEKLKEILDNQFMMGLGIAAAEDIDPDEKDKAILNTQKHYSKENQEAIKQAFKDDGWMPLPKSKEIYSVKSGELIAVEVYTPQEYMTGPEWLARLEKELRTDMLAEGSNLDDIYCGELTTLEDIMIIAKRAAGVSNV